jgi:hypothetical protein
LPLIFDFLDEIYVLANNCRQIKLSMAVKRLAAGYEQKAKR